MNSLKKTLILGGIVLSIIAGCSQTQDSNQPQATITIADQEFTVEVANNPETRKEGLMNRTELAKSEGMFFIFPASETRTFWMKNTLIPLDIIFANNNEITKIHHSAEPCEADPCPQYNSDTPSNQVIEINGGLSKELGITEGQTFKFSLNE